MKFGIATRWSSRPVDERVECGRVHAATGLSDLVPHGISAGAHVDGASVGEAGPVRRVQPLHGEQFAEIGTRIPSRGTDGASD
jgi:hypothetical protein